MDIQPVEQQVFKGNQFTSVLGIMIWGFAFVFPAIIFFISDAEFAIGMWIFFMCLLFLPLSLLLNYFEIEQNSIVVRNHNYFWKRRRYYFDDFSEVIFQTRGNRSGNKCITVVLNSGKIKHHQSQSLKDRDWLAFKRALIARGLKVTDKLDLERAVSPVQKRIVNRIVFVGVTINLLNAVLLVSILDGLDLSKNMEIVVKLVDLVLMVAASIWFLRVYPAYLQRKYKDELDREEAN